jgi:hypothetical protein
MMWRDIATAPKDGTAVLVWVDWYDGPQCEIGVFKGDEFFPQHRKFCSKCPAAWMPLPPPPAMAPTGEPK